MSSKILENVEIVDISAEGKAVAKTNEGMIIFVERGVPGDCVDIEVQKKKKNFAEGTIIAYKKKSEWRTEPFCRHFGICGGCKWQMMSYHAQVMFKQKYVTDAFERIGKIYPKEILPIVESRTTQHYRNKMEYSFSNNRWLTQDEISSGEKFERNALGFHIPGRFDKIVDIQTCYLQETIGDEIRNFVRSYALQHSLEFYDIKKQTGYLRNMIIRITHTGQIMLIIVFRKEDKYARIQLLDAIIEKFPHIHSLQYVINPKVNDTISDLQHTVYYGLGSIGETMENITYILGPKSFFQTNTLQAYKLYCIIREFAQFQGNEIVYDLYTGIGSIALFIAEKVKKVIGVEYIPEAIEDAKLNAQSNRIYNTEFFAGDIKDIVTSDFIIFHGKPDVVILDPPRAGVHENVIRVLLQSRPQKIV
ncbi:MAG: 23S rRNA (uracil(1939)-C(5))-methyltransferase RlmD, partial [Bacteroidales bacterium]